jgi:branched-chain amino acid transport system substrate-binding protein
MNRKWRVVFSCMSSCIIALCTMLLVCGCSKKSPETERMRIGVILPLTGDGASLGTDCRNGVELAVEESRGAMRIDVVYEDSQGKPDLAVSAFNKLKAEGVRVIIGDLFSSPTLAIAPLADRSRILVLSPGASNPALSGMSKWVFRNYPSDNFEGQLIAKYIKEKGFERAAVLYPTNDYGNGLKEVFAQSLKNLGGQVVLLEAYDESASDFRAILTKLSDKRADAIYLPGYYKAIAMIAVQARELGLSTPLFSNVGVEDPQIIKLGGSAVEGLCFTAPGVDFKSQDQITQNFVTRYKANFGKEPGFPAAHGYDSATILLELISNYGSNPDALREGLLSKDFIGVMGKTKFTPQGDVVRPFVIKVIRDGKFETIGRVAL